MIFAIIPNLTRRNAAGVTRLICGRLDELGAAYSLPLDTKEVFSDTKAVFLQEKELLESCEAVITVGGDGTIIHSAKKAAGLFEARFGYQRRPTCVYGGS